MFHFAIISCIFAPIVSQSSMLNVSPIILSSNLLFSFYFHYLCKRPLLQVAQQNLELYNCFCVFCVHRQNFVWTHSLLFQVATFDVQCWLTFKSHLDRSPHAFEFETSKLPFFSFPISFFQAFFFLCWCHCFHLVNLISLFLCYVPLHQPYHKIIVGQIYQWSLFKSHFVSIWRNGFVSFKLHFNPKTSNKSSSHTWTLVSFVFGFKPLLQVNI